MKAKSSCGTMKKGSASKPVAKKVIASAKGIKTKKPY
jgi:hypothetical protein